MTIHLDGHANELKPGIELNIRVAKEILGWTGINKQITPALWENDPPVETWFGIDPEDGVPYFLPDYSTEVRDAWKVQDKLHELGYIIQILRFGKESRSPSMKPGTYQITLWKHINKETGELRDWAIKSIPDDWREVEACVIAATFPHAICVAALVAKERELAEKWR